MIDIGSVINGKYRLIRLVGDGGMGSVYEGLHLVLGTRVAIKLLHPDLARRTGLVERFLQEARVAAQIRSPHVVQVTDVDRTPDGHAYIVMELLEGEPLSSVLDRVRRLPVPTACEYALQILGALEAAHALGVIHRDLKPENVFVTHAGGKPVLKLIDFGIAKARRTDPQQKNLTVAGVVMGTAEYMAPEQARSADKVDARADIYAVGVMLYEMLAGVRPVNGDDARIIALKVERGEVTPLLQNVPDVPRELAGLVHRAMAPRPELRFATATEMRIALERAHAAKRGTAGVPAAALNGPGAPMAEMTANGTLKNVSAQQVLGAGGPGRVATAPVAIPPGAPPPGAMSGTAAMPAMGPGAMPPGGPEAMEPEAHTQRAPPLATAMAAPLGVGMGMGMNAGPGVGGVTPMPATPSYDGAPRRRRGNRGAVIALVALAVLLGAGVVVMLVNDGTLPLSGGDTPPPNPTPPAPAPPSEPGTATGSSGAPPAPPSTVPALTTTKPAPGPSPRPTPSNHPTPVPDAGGVTPYPPFVLPSTLPPIPSIFPLPSTMPTLFPPWPAPPAPAPTPTKAGGQTI